MDAAGGAGVAFDHVNPAPVVDKIKRCLPVKRIFHGKFGNKIMDARLIGTTEIGGSRTVYQIHRIVHHLRRHPPALADGVAAQRFAGNALLLHPRFGGGYVQIFQGIRPGRHQHPPPEAAVNRFEHRPAGRRPINIVRRSQPPRVRKPNRRVARQIIKKAPLVVQPQQQSARRHKQLFPLRFGQRHMGEIKNVFTGGHHKIRFGNQTAHCRRIARKIIARGRNTAVPHTRIAPRGKRRQRKAQAVAQHGFVRIRKHPHPIQHRRCARRSDEYIHNVSPELALFTVRSQHTLP